MNRRACCGRIVAISAIVVGMFAAGVPNARSANSADSDRLPNVIVILADDLGEQKNVAAEHPEIVERLTRLMQQYVDEGRRTPGLRQANTVPVKFTPPGTRTR